MTVKITLPDNLYRCPQPWINFIEYCQARCPQGQDIEQYVDKVLLTKYQCRVYERYQCAEFAEPELYTLFIMEWA